ncbi:VENN motif pre-toxin domain-containing protein [Pantoea agglomerans]|uniref:VENN motif pre-toxin domain-containing protein n=1 Tax=Enterobacter agglomerans TaxID=549 RepID=UPI001F077FEA|nr:VENN motif pre-toxin domain-containing protein [Pantoea agglomerans]
MLSYNDALSHLLYGKDASKLSADDKMLVANIVTHAGATAGGAVDGNSGVGSGASASRTEVENNYLSSTEKSRQTYLNNKQNLTPEEQKGIERSNRKDLESDMAVYAACNGTGAGCQAEREKAKAAQDTYFNQTYQNPKEAQAGYQQIVNLLNSTDPNAKEVFNILEGYTQAFMSFGYTEDEAKARAGAYVGSMYIASGVSAVVASGALAKQFGKDVAPSVKLGGSTVSSFDANEIRFSQNTVSYNKTERDPNKGVGVKYTYDDLVASMKKDGWQGNPVDVIKMPDGKMTSMDNTRISAAREADIKVEANVRSYDEKLTPLEIERFSDRKRGFVPQTWGEAISGRINKQSGGFSNNNPYDSNESPRITGKGK